MVAGTVVCEGDVCRIVPAVDAPAPATKAPAFNLSSLLGEQLKGKEGTIDTSGVKSKYVGLYFSAHWCPPCRGFTPKLAEFYKAFQASRKDDFEIIFISSDKDQESFDSYYSEMPWLALPFDQRDLKAKLSSKFKVSGIPSFVILDTFTGAVVNPQARGAVGEDPEGKDFPWRPKTISQLLSGAELVDKAGNTYKSDDLLNGKTKMVYFSAHWCPPCRGFTPQLAETYTKMKAAGRDFELIFVSSDKDQASFDGYLAEMPWQALKFEDRKRKAELSEAFKVNGIPTLVVLDEKNNIITTSGRGSVAADPEGHKFPWVAEPVALLGEDSVDIVNEIPTVIFISNAQEAAEVEKKAKETLEALAIKSKADVDAGKKEESLGFLFGPSKGNQVMESVLKFAGVKVEDGQDALIILNVGEQCLYKLEGEVDVEAAIKFVAEFEAGTLTKIKIGGNEDDE